jgi:hypothetical protein
MPANYARFLLLSDFGWMASYKEERGRRRIARFRWKEVSRLATAEQVRS